MTDDEWEKAAGEVCSLCKRESFVIFDHPLGRVCKSCYNWLLDNYIADGEKVKAKLLPDGRIILFHGKTKRSEPVSVRH